MKKSIKLLTCVSVAVVLVCLLAVSAFAVNKKGDFTVNILGGNFTGEYEAELNLRSSYADCSFKVTHYTGFVNGGDDSDLNLAVYGVKEDGTRELLASGRTYGPLGAHGSVSYTYKAGVYDRLQAEGSCYFYDTLIATVIDSINV